MDLRFLEMLPKDFIPASIEFEFTFACLIGSDIKLILNECLQAAVPEPAAPRPERAAHGIGKSYAPNP
jgi:hypothetical protein